MIILIVILIALVLIFGLSRILEADALDTVLTALIIVGSVAVLALIFYLGLLVWRGLR